ncbi:hypothetical protein OQA88_8259 [Cercophora sp. LCS_1]
MSDAEKQDHNAPGGHARLGQLMGRYPETAIVRRFLALSAQDILHRQAELAELEAALKEYQQKDDDVPETSPRKRYAVNWGRLQESGYDDAPEGSDSAQLETMMEIRDKIKDYHEALLRHRQVLELGHAVPRQVSSLHQWMDRPTMGNVRLEGYDKDIWKSPDLDDMVALIPPSDRPGVQNPLILWIIHAYNYTFGRFIHKSGNQDYTRNTIVYPPTKIYWILKTIATIIACLLPIGGVFVLNAITTLTNRLWAMASFTILAAFCLCVLTSASIPQIFAATSAFAAVLVVFVGTTDGLQGMPDERPPSGG